MNSSFFKYSTVVLFLLVFFIIFSFFTLAVNSDYSQINNLIIDSNYYSSDFCWPTPNFYSITSYFGYRNRPTNGASTYHSGIDIAAPMGSKVIASFSGVVDYTGFKGGNGFTVIITNNGYSAEYSHLSPEFLCSIGDFVFKGDVIGSVGPKNVFGIPNNPYKDTNGNPTNGATTGPHLHFSIKKDGKAVNPLDYISSSSSSSI